MMSNDKKEFVRRVADGKPAMAEATTALRFILTEYTDELGEIKRDTLVSEREHGFVVLNDDEMGMQRAVMHTGGQGEIKLTDYTLEDNEVPLLSIHTHLTNERVTHWPRDIYGPAFPQEGDVMTHFERLEKLGPVFGVLAVGDGRPPSLIVYSLCEDKSFTCAQAIYDALSQEQYESHYKELIEGHTAWTLTP